MLFEVRFARKGRFEREEKWTGLGDCVGQLWAYFSHQEDANLFARDLIAKGRQRVAIHFHPA